MSEMQHRSRRGRRQDCAFGYLTMAPIGGHHEERQAAEADARTGPPRLVHDGSNEPGPGPISAVLVVRRPQRRTFEVIG